MLANTEQQQQDAPHCLEAIPIHTGDTCVNLMSVLSLLLKGATKPVAVSLSVFLQRVYTSLTQCIINHSRRQFNYSKQTEIRASYPFCNQQPLSRRQKEQIRLLCWLYAGQRRKQKRPQTCRKDRRKRKSTLRYKHSYTDVNDFRELACSLNTWQHHCANFK